MKEVTKKNHPRIANGLRLPPGTGILRHWVNYSGHIGLGRIIEACLYRGEGYDAPPRALRKHPNFTLCYTLDGHGVYRDASGRSQHLAPGDVVLTAPGFAYWTGPRADSVWTEFDLKFDGPLFDLWREHALSDRVLFRHCKPMDVWQRKLEEIASAPRHPGRRAQLKEVIQLQDFLFQVLFVDQAAGDPSDDRLVSRACTLLGAVPSRQISVSRLARELGCSYAYLNRQFVREMGMPPVRYRISRLIEQACRLMAEGQLTDKEIADQLGFSSPAYFSRRFRLVTGASPRAYRRILPGPQKHEA
ncbi:MAG TPA: AraC family transcriptional regulator [Polyangiaceae bacterium]|jgi:AraC-like DNA-binding protein